MGGGTKVNPLYEAFMSEGTISIPEAPSTLKNISILRDTGATVSIISDKILNLDSNTYTGKNVLLKGIGKGRVSTPLHKLHLTSKYFSSPSIIGVVSEWKFNNIDLILGNDLCGDKVHVDPILDMNVTLSSGDHIVNSNPNTGSNLDDPDICGCFTSCAVTRAQQARLSAPAHKPVKSSICDSTFNQIRSDLSISRDDFIRAQQSDPDFIKLSPRIVSETDIEKEPIGYFKRDGLLLRKFRPPHVYTDDISNTIFQIMVPRLYRNTLIEISHSRPFAGHFGVNKTSIKLLEFYYWPNLRKHVADFVKSCDTCQRVGKPSQPIPRAPLIPIPTTYEPFSRLILDCVGPMERTKSGKSYLLTIMCVSTRFVEAIPLRDITASNIKEPLLKFFSTYGFPTVIQTDLGSNFTSKLFGDVLKGLGIKHETSTFNHPESQGALERFHQTMKSMIKKYCFETKNDWDKGIPMLMFAARDAIQESTGFSAFEMVYGHTVRGPLKIIADGILDKVPSEELITKVGQLRDKMAQTWEFARNNMADAQVTMKTWYDQKSRKRKFDPGDQVLILLPIPGQPLFPKFQGPYTIVSQSNEVNYVVRTPDKRKKLRICHVNLLKKYHPSVPDITIATSGALVAMFDPDQCDFETEPTIATAVISEEKGDFIGTAKLENSDALKHLDEKLSHLLEDQQILLKNLIFEFADRFPDVPSTTNMIVHDVDVGDAKPVKQRAYRANPDKQSAIDKEIKYMLDNGILEPSSSPWSSPCIVICKPDGVSYRFCTDYRKVNELTVTDSYPLPRIEDCIDQIGKCKYVTKFDLLKGYWQVPLTDRAKLVSACVTSRGLYQYTVTPFGMKNSGATFQRLMNTLCQDVDDCNAYVDDVVIFSTDWDEHLKTMRQFFTKTRKANLTINLVKSEFGHAQLQYLGHIVGSGKVLPREAKVEAIDKFPVPSTKKELMRFLGMTGYYRKFVPNFSTIAEPLTKLLKKEVKFIWNDFCQESFEKLRSILKEHPVLASPDFAKPFRLTIDASDVGAGSVLSQCDTEGIEHPVAFFSKKFHKHELNYSTIEKETLSLLLSLEHFDVYVGSTKHTLEVWTDHNPLVFISRMQNKNQRLMRWSLALQSRDLDIKHIAGKDNVLADALSRIEIDSVGRTEAINPHFCNFCEVDID